MKTTRRKKIERRLYDHGLFIGNSLLSPPPPTLLASIGIFYLPRERRKTKRETIGRWAYRQ
jgi:hypothetical protein